MSQADKVAFRVTVSARDARESTRLQLFHKEIICFRVVCITDADAFARNESGLAVKGGVAFQNDGAVSQQGSLFQRSIEQKLSKALPLKFRRDAQRTGVQHRKRRAVLALDRRADKADLPDEDPGPFQNKVQFRHECRVLPQTVKHKVLHAAGAVDVPERAADKRFGGSVVVFGFETDEIVSLTHCFSS